MPLYLVATPIGNLEDLSFRALRTLKDAGCVVSPSRNRWELVPGTSYQDGRTKAAKRPVGARSHGGGPRVAQCDFGPLEEALGLSVEVPAQWRHTGRRVHYCLSDNGHCERPELL